MARALGTARTAARTVSQRSVPTELYVTIGRLAKSAAWVGLSYRRTVSRCLALQSHSAQPVRRMADRQRTMLPFGNKVVSRPLARAVYEPLARPQSFA